MDGKKSSAYGKTPISPNSQRERERAIELRRLNERLDKAQKEVEKRAKELEATVKANREKQERREKEQRDKERQGSSKGGRY